MARCAMIGQSVINVKSGGRGRLSTMTAGVILLVMVVFLGDLVARIPMAALVAVMLMVSIGTFNWESLRNLRTHPRSSSLVMITTVIVVVATHDLARGVLAGVLAPLTFLHVIDRHLEVAPMHDFSGSLGLGAQESLLHELSVLDEQRSRLAQEHGRQILQVARARASAAGLGDVDARQHHGTLVDTLLEWQDEIRLVVLGQHPQDAGAARRHLDHQVERVIRDIRRPVLVASGAFRPVERFVIAFDASATGRRMVDTVARSPFLRGIPCEVVTSTSAPASVADDLRWAEQTLAGAGYDVRTATVGADPEVALNQRVRDHDMHLLVMGAYGHSRIRHMVVGSTTTSLLRTSAVPVLVLR